MGVRPEGLREAGERTCDPTQGVVVRGVDLPVVGLAQARGDQFQHDEGDVAMRGEVRAELRRRDRHRGRSLERLGRRRTDATLDGRHLAKQFACPSQREDDLAALLAHQRQLDETLGDHEDAVGPAAFVEDRASDGEVPLDRQRGKRGPVAAVLTLQEPRRLAHPCHRRDQRARPLRQT